jgi:hypothetical protein
MNLKHGRKILWSSEVLKVLGNNFKFVKHLPHCVVIHNNEDDRWRVECLFV